MGEQSISASPGWGQIAQRYREAADQRSPASTRVLRAEMLRLAGGVRGRRVLEVGLGDGSLTCRLAERGACVLGVDGSAEAIDRARDTAASLDVESPPAFLRVAVERDEALPAGPFDLLVTAAPAEGVPATPDLIRTLATRVRRGGRMVLALPHPQARQDAPPRMLEHLFGWLRAAGLRVIDLVEPGTSEGDTPEFVVVLAERLKRSARRPKPSRRRPEHTTRGEGHRRE